MAIPVSAGMAQRRIRRKAGEIQGAALPWASSQYAGNANGQWRNKTHSKPICNGYEQSELETDGGENPF